MMRSANRRWLCITLSLAFAFGIRSAIADSYAEHSSLLKKLAGNWVTVQAATVASDGLVFGEREIPAGATISSVTLWSFSKDGSCRRKGFANIDGNAAELVIPLEACHLYVDRDGTGTIEVFSPLSDPSVLRIIVVDVDDIVATSSESAVSAFTFKRQKIHSGDRRCRSRKCK